MYLVHSRLVKKSTIIIVKGRFIIELSSMLIVPFFRGFGKRKNIPPKPYTMLNVLFFQKNN